METEKLQCKKCNWTGNSDEVNWDTVDTCMGSDKIEICPVCGSMEVYHVYSDKILKTVHQIDN